MGNVLASCSQIIQTVDLKINTLDDSAAENFSVIEKTLTIREARRQVDAPYVRTLLKNGRGDKSKPILEHVALSSKFPDNNSKIDYKIGIGDTLTFSKLTESNQTLIDIKNDWPTKQGDSSYKLGVGDTLELTLVKQIKSDPQMVPSGENLIITTQPSIDKTITSTGRVGSDGSVLLLSWTP